MAANSFFLGRLIAIGGNEDKVNELLVLKRVVREVGKPDYKVGVITTASQEPEQRGQDYQKVFTTLGASEVKILTIRTRAQANDDTLVKTLEDVDLIFLTGGDQLRLTTIMGGSKILVAIQNRLEAGALIAGTSAGAAVFSDTMIYEGESEEGLLKGRVLMTAGFGFVNNIVFDTHFMARGRIGRLVQIVTTNPTCIGVGIGEDSGVILKGDETVEVIGTGQVIIVDGSDIAHSNIMDIKPGEPIAVENVRIHSLVNGYGYNFKNRQFLIPSS
ncbi:MAG: cyanophycinase [Proteobacteria bacterium]|nr:cyanophycinase [Desulfobacula sp.]MBU3953431.1 cyanophycinase [Pseudomonadota bacterium]MBU4132409.1 cyanophycinase [Pseudomonadota bacterium]